MLLQALSEHPNHAAGLTGSALIDAMRNSPYKDVDLVQPRLYFALNEPEI